MNARAVLSIATLCIFAAAKISDTYIAKLVKEQVNHFFKAAPGLDPKFDIDISGYHTKTVKTLLEMSSWKMSEIAPFNEHFRKELIRRGVLPIETTHNYFYV